MKKNGFVSSSVIYSFFIIFLLLMVYLISSYSSTRYMLSQIKYDIRSGVSLVEGDINLYIYIYDKNGESFTLVNEVPMFGYDYVKDFSSCSDGSRIEYKNSELKIYAQGNDKEGHTTCKVYFTQTDSDINLSIYTKEDDDAKEILVTSVPDSKYELTSSSCKKGIIQFNEGTRRFSVKTNSVTDCKAVFTKRDNIVTIKYYTEDAGGNRIYNNFIYSEEKSYPSSEYNFYEYKCLNNTIIKNDPVNRTLIYDEKFKDTCYIFFRGGSKKVNMKYYREDENGEVGKINNKLYTETVNIPQVGHVYIGYKCDKDGIINYNNGSFTGLSNMQDTCYLYFDRYSDNVKLTYYLEDENDSYIEVEKVPNFGYTFNSEKSSCKNGSEITYLYNTIYVSNDDDCDIYFDRGQSDEVE